MQRGHDEVANGHRHHGNHSFGQAEQHEQRSNESRKRRLAQPTQGKRCKRNAQLAGRQILVHVQGNFHGRLGARLALLYGELELRLAHTHEREFGDDEECVHGQEKYDEDKAYANRHERKFTLSKGRLADGPTFADMRFLLLQFVTITKIRPTHATRGETLPNCYKNSSSTRNAAAKK